MMYHEPVLKNKVAEYLINDKKGVYLEGTLGGGGHSEIILSHLKPAGKLISLDLDDDAINYAGDRLKSWAKQIMIRKANFKKFDDVLHEFGIKKIDGLLLDLGVSSYQIDTAAKGFSFSKKGNLDMRMNGQQNLTAHDIINTYPEQDLLNIFKNYGEENRAKSIAKRICYVRNKARIKTTGELVDIIASVTPVQNRVKSLARIFQALRIVVNDELINLQQTLEKSMDFIRNSGRIVVISYHSLEDRIVKSFFKNEASRCECPPEWPVCICKKQHRLRILTKQPIVPAEEEKLQNPRSRSAKLRAAEVI